ncbi:MAG: hypothetical protein IJE44_04740 [Clostridia bacterium]|nr:hypothetical protein [Clostridia bacterium]
MQNKLPEKYGNSFFSKIKRFFANIFKKNNAIIEKKVDSKKENVELKSKENEFEKMKKSSNKVEIKEDILSLIEKKPDLIDTLPLERLKELDNMYDEIIEENERKIKNLRREIA